VGKRPCQRHAMTLKRGRVKGAKPHSRRCSREWGQFDFSLDYDGYECGVDFSGAACVDIRDCELIRAYTES